MWPIFVVSGPKEQQVSIKTKHTRDKVFEVILISMKRSLFPLFLNFQHIPSLPGVCRMGVDIIIDEMDKLVPLGLSSVLLFAVPDESGKEKAKLQ